MVGVDACVYPSLSSSSHTDQLDPLHRPTPRRRQEEDEQYKDKEVFVTSAYKKKLMEMKKWEAVDKCVRWGREGGRGVLVPLLLACACPCPCALPCLYIHTHTHSHL